jgi:UDP-N-acetylmuramate--alanine ligase
MSGLAKLALELGHEVSGSDLKNNRVTEVLRALGAEVFLGHDPRHLAADVAQVVYSSAVGEDNPELAEARRRGLEVMSRGEYLARLMGGYEGIAVAGTHGKTTTAAMIAVLLKRTGLDPTVAVGGTVVAEGTNAWLGRGRYMVAEADESDGSFLLLRPRVAVVTNVEEEHLDYYGDFRSLKEAFRQFVLSVGSEGLAVLGAEDQFLADLAREISRSVTYGCGGIAAYRAEIVALDRSGSQSLVWEGEERLGKLELRVPGWHNVLNALAAVAVGRLLELPFSRIAEALAGFTGVARRLERIGEAGGRWIIDDYAHHPTEIQATLAAVRHFGGRIIAIFQPHRYSRVSRLYRWFGSAFANADAVVVTDIYAAGEPPIDGVSGELIAEEVRRYGRPPVYYCPDRDELEELVDRLTRPGDVILTIGAGDIGDLGRRLLARWSFPGGVQVR